MARLATTSARMHHKSAPARAPWRRLAGRGVSSPLLRQGDHKTRRPLTAIHSYDPKTGHGLKRDPLNAIIAPPADRLDLDGQRRRRPQPRAMHGFFNAFNYRPPIIGFSSTGWKDSVRNIEETGQFVWNLATRPLAQAVNATSAMVPHHVDEFDLAGLTAAPSQVVAAPRVAESPVAFECRLTQLIRLTDAEGAPVDAWLTLGEVVMVHIDEALLVDGVYDTVAGRADPAGRRAHRLFRRRQRPGSSTCAAPASAPSARRVDHHATRRSFRNSAAHTRCCRTANSLCR